VNINISANSGRENKKQITATSGRLIVAVYASVGYVYITCTCLSSLLEDNSTFVGLGVWGAIGLLMLIYTGYCD